MPRYRVKAYSRVERQPRGYVGTHRVHYQELQVKRWWGWKTIDTEEVPNWHIIEQACLGSSGWRSKFYKFGWWDRDGVVHKHAVDM